MLATVRCKRPFADRRLDSQRHEGQDSDQLGLTYAGRLLQCTRFNHLMEARWMQLRTSNGDRGIHCEGCHKHERCSHNWCQRNFICRQCELHRIDLATHRSRKAPKTRKEYESRHANCLGSNRRAPEIKESEGKQNKRRTEMHDKTHYPKLHAPQRIEASICPPYLVLLSKVRGRERSTRRARDEANPGRGESSPGSTGGRSGHPNEGEAELRRGEPSLGSSAGRSGHPEDERNEHRHGRASQQQLLQQRRCDHQQPRLEDKTEVEQQQPHQKKEVGQSLGSKPSGGSHMDVDPIAPTAQVAFIQVTSERGKATKGEDTKDEATAKRIRPIKSSP